MHYKHDAQGILILLLINKDEKYALSSPTDFKLTSKGYAMNLGSKGMSGSELPYLTRHTNSDLE